MDSKRSSSTVIPDHQPSAIEKLVAFIDERVGLKEMQAKMLNEPIPGGSRWAYVFGSILLFIFAMQALTGTLKERAEASLKAGCDVVLHCNGRLDEMTAVAEAAPPLEGLPLRRAEDALRRIRHAPEPFDAADVRTRLEAALAAVA